MKIKAPETYFSSSSIDPDDAEDTIARFIKAMKMEEITSFEVFVGEVRRTIMPSFSGFSVSFRRI